MSGIYRGGLKGRQKGVGLQELAASRALREGSGPRPVLGLSACSVGSLAVNGCARYSLHRWPRFETDADFTRDAPFCTSQHKEMVMRPLQTQSCLPLYHVLASPSKICLYPCRVIILQYHLHPDKHVNAAGLRCE